MDLTFLKEKLGPLPMAAWIALGVAGALAWMRWGRKADGTVTGPLDALITSGQQPPAEIPPTIPVPEPPLGGNPFVGPLPGQPDIFSNQEWGAVSADWLLSQGRDPVAVTRSLNAYLAGQPVLPGDVSLVEAALRQFGVPPDGAPPLSIALPPGPTPTPTPATPRYWTAPNRTTDHWVAKNITKTTVGHFQALNGWQGRPRDSTIRKGQRVRIG